MTQAEWEEFWTGNGGQWTQAEIRFFLERRARAVRAIYARLEPYGA